MYLCLCEMLCKITIIHRVSEQSNEHFDVKNHLLLKNFVGYPRNKNIYHENFLHVQHLTVNFPQTTVQETTVHRRQ